MLNFKNHIHSVVKTCNYHIRNLYSIRKFLDQDCLITLVHSLIVSRVDCCNSLYLGLPNYLLKKLQSIMNKSARLIFSVAPRVPTTRVLIKLHWLPIKARIEFKICLIVFKALRFGQPKYIADMLSPPVTISHLTLRSDDDPYRLHEPRAVGERAFAERSFVYTAPRLYNGLPASVKQQASVQSFEIHLKKFLFSRAYNSGTNTVNLSIYIPWPFPPAWGVADNTEEQQKQWGPHSVPLAMTRDPAEFGWHCWSNAAHPPPSSTTYVASQMPSPLLPLPQGCPYKATPWQR